MRTSDTLDRFIAMVEANAHVEACEEFYTPDSSTQTVTSRLRANTE
jgi:hypothetical protein